MGIKNSNMYDFVGKVVYHYESGARQECQYVSLAASTINQSAKSTMVDLGATHFEVIKY